jgi:hypothetical protein
MKTLTLIISIAMLTVASCTKEQNPQTNKTDETKKQLLGEWYNPNYVEGCDTCEKFIFTEEGEIMQVNPNETLKYLFTLLSKDSISVTREWNIEFERKHTTHLITLITSDSLKIKQFLAVDYGVSNFVDVVLFKK